MANTSSTTVTHHGLGLTSGCSRVKNHFSVLPSQHMWRLINACHACGCTARIKKKKKKKVPNIKIPHINYNPLFGKTRDDLTAGGTETHTHNSIVEKSNEDCGKKMKNALTSICE